MKKTALFFLISCLSCAAFSANMSYLVNRIDNTYICYDVISKELFKEWGSYDDYCLWDVGASFSESSHGVKLVYSFKVPEYDLYLGFQEGGNGVTVSLVKKKMMWDLSTFVQYQPTSYILRAVNYKDGEYTLYSRGMYDPMLVGSEYQMKLGHLSDPLKFRGALIYINEAKK